MKLLTLCTPHKVSPSTIERLIKLLAVHLLKWGEYVYNFEDWHQSLVKSTKVYRKLNNFTICIGICLLSENINSPMSNIQDGNTDYQKTSTIELQVAFSSSARKTTMYARKETMVRKKLSLITDTTLE